MGVKNPECGTRFTRLRSVVHQLIAHPCVRRPKPLFEHFIGKRNCVIIRLQMETNGQLVKHVEKLMPLVFNYFCRFLPSMQLIH